MEVLLSTNSQREKKSQKKIAQIPKEGMSSAATHAATASIKNSFAGERPTRQGAQRNDAVSET